VIDCITGFAPQITTPQTPVFPRDDSALSPTAASPLELLPHSPGPPAAVEERAEGVAVNPAAEPPAQTADSPKGEIEAKVHKERRRRQLGSDMEVLVRAFCAERGWNAVISRRRRGCLACAIREAGALGWKVVIRVD